MTDQPAATTTPGGEDLEYDLVHETDHDRAGPSAVEVEHADKPGVSVPNQTPAYDGDYGYDMSHDIPR